MVILSLLPDYLSLTDYLSHMFAAILCCSILKWRRRKTIMFPCQLTFSISLSTMLSSSNILICRSQFKISFLYESSVMQSIFLKPLISTPHPQKVFDVALAWTLYSAVIGAPVAVCAYLRLMILCMPWIWVGKGVSTVLICLLSWFWFCLPNHVTNSPFFCMENFLPVIELERAQSELLLHLWVFRWT